MPSQGPPPKPAPSPRLQAPGPPAFPPAKPTASLTKPAPPADARPRGGSLSGREEMPGDGRGSAVLAAQLHAGVPFRLRTPPPGGSRVHGNHHALQGRTKLAGGLVFRPDENFALYRSSQVVIERSGPQIDEHGRPQVDRSLAQRGLRRGQPAGHADRQVHPPFSGALRQGQGERYLIRCELRGKLPGRVTLELGIIHDTPAASELGDRGQFGPSVGSSGAGSSAAGRDLPKRGGGALGGPLGLLPSGQILACPVNDGQCHRTVSDRRRPVTARAGRAGQWQPMPPRSPRATVRLDAADGYRREPGVYISPA